VKSFENALPTKAAVAAIETWLRGQPTPDLQAGTLSTAELAASLGRRGTSLRL